MNEFVIFDNAIQYELDRLNVVSDFFNSISDTEILKHEYSYFLKITFSYIEIRNSLNRLTKIAKYISWSPNTKNINYRYDMLRYHFENHCHESYILKERLIAFINILKKIYKNRINNNSTVLSYNGLYTLISKSMNDFTQERSLHVHKKRMPNPNTEYFSLLSIILADKFEKHKGLKDAFFSDEYKKLKNEYTQKVKERNLIIDDLVEKVFSNINSLVLIDNKYIAKPDVG